MEISILDQSPVISGLSARRAIEETLALARRADELGYHRYWLAEHHAIAALADPCPEVLLARLGAETRRIRIGTGGVLLPYYSAFRTAESFRMLEALYPGRIDLGIGRAPGGDQRTALAVGGGSRGGVGGPSASPSADAASFPQQVWELTALLEGTLEEKTPRLQPEVDTVPEVWLLGSSDYSGALAAELGLPFAFAHFINPRGGDAVSRAYRETFKATEKRPRPRVIVCTFAIVAETDDEAERLAAPIDLRRLHMALNIDSPVPTARGSRAAPLQRRGAALCPRPARTSGHRGSQESKRRIANHGGALRGGRAHGPHHHRRLRLAPALLRATDRSVLAASRSRRALRASRSRARSCRRGSSPAHRRRAQASAARPRYGR